MLILINMESMTVPAKVLPTARQDCGKPPSPPGIIKLDSLCGFADEWRHNNKLSIAVTASHLLRQGLQR